MQYNYSPSEMLASELLPCMTLLVHTVFKSLSNKCVDRYII